MHRLLCVESKSPNQFVFTLGRYLFLLFLVQLIGFICRTKTMHQLLCFQEQISYPLCIHIWMFLAIFDPFLFIVDVNYSYIYLVNIKN